MRGFISGVEAAALVQDGWTVTTGGFGSCGHPEALTEALRRRFLGEGRPRDLTLVFAAGQGDRAARGLNRIALAGLVKRAIGGFWALTPALSELVRAQAIEAYNWPQGVVSHLFRAVAAGSPGVITAVGLDTFIDPRFGGGRLTSKCVDDLVELVEVAGNELLLYRAFPIHCALIRATAADSDGNLGMADEANLSDALTQAQAAHNSGGLVIAQVRDLVAGGQLPPHQVRVPGILVDYVVRAERDEHWQTYGTYLDPSFTSSRPPPAGDPARPLDARKIVARRAYLEICALAHPIVNLGIGIPERISEVAEEEGHAPFTLTVESGAVGGLPAGALSFGASRGPQALLEQSAQFDFYDGGGIDMAFLGCGQVDPDGNVNVSHLGDRINGVGGFVNISQAAKRVAFCGPFTTGGLEVACQDGRLTIVREGRHSKFVPEIASRCFSAARARARHQEVLYVTERAVFRMAESGVELVELAPGVDLERDVARSMGPGLRVARDVRPMDRRLFEPGPMMTPLRGSRAGASPSETNVAS